MSTEKPDWDKIRAEAKDAEFEEIPSAGESAGALPPPESVEPVDPPPPTSAEEAQAGEIRERLNEAASSAETIPNAEAALEAGPEKQAEAVKHPGEAPKEKKAETLRDALKKKEYLNAASIAGRRGLTGVGWAAGATAIGGLGAVGIGYIAGLGGGPAGYSLGTWALNNVGSVVFPIAKFLGVFGAIFAFPQILGKILDGMEKRVTGASPKTDHGHGGGHKPAGGGASHH